MAALPHKQIPDRSIRENFEALLKRLNVLERLLNSVGIRYGTVDCTFTAAQDSAVQPVPHGLSTCFGAVAMPLGIGGTSYTIVGQVSGSNINFVMRNNAGAVSTTRTAFWIAVGTP